jgi:hypothetical protein
MPVAAPYTNLTLGVNPETLNQYFQQYYSAGFPNGILQMGVASDQAVVFQLTSAQLLALNTTAVQLVAPPVTTGIPGYLVPPRGFLYVPTTLSIEYVYGGTAYTIGGTSPVIQIEYTGKAGNLISLSPTGLLDQTVNTVASVTSVNIAPIALTNCANLGLEVKLGGTTPTLTLGNGTVVITLLFNLQALL